MSSSENDKKGERERSISFLLNLRNDKEIFAAALDLPNRMTGAQARASNRSRQLHTELVQYAAELNGLSDEELSARAKKTRGLLEKRRQDDEARFHFNQTQALADVSYWCVWPDWSIEEGIALVLDRDPRMVTWDTVKSYVNVSVVAKQFADLMRLAERARIAGQLQARTRPGEFLRWVERTKQVDSFHRLRAAMETHGIVVADWQDVANEQSKQLKRCTDLIDQLTGTLNTQRAQLQKLIAERDLLAAQATNSGPWPWGKHQTPLLDHLAAAAERFWKLYDASDPSTAPTNEQVISWLLERAVSQRVAEVFAQTLRSPDIPPGPRK